MDQSTWIKTMGGGTEKKWKVRDVVKMAELLGDRRKT
jgi:hypothetical protein